jgi:MYXO-CTERM domain-containing protein
VTGNLTFTTNDPDFPSVAVPLSGTGVQPPTVSLSHSSLAFGQQRVGTTSGLFLTVSNTGGSTLVVSTVSTSGPFSVSPSQAFTLPPSGNQSLVVKFTPTAEGAVTGTLPLKTNDPARPTATVSLSGTGVKPVLSLSATSLDFGEQRVGTTSTALTVTVSNTGSGPIHVATLSTSGPFSLFMAPVLPFTLVPDASQTLQVMFSPTTQGVATGTLTLTTNDPDWSSVTVALMGTGAVQQPSLSLSATSLAFGEQRVGTTSAPKTVTVSNTGTSTLRITSLAIGTGEPFTVTPHTAFELAAGASRELAVTFSPTRQSVATGTLTLTSDDPLNPNATVSLTGTGVKPALALSPASLDFGGQPVGSTSAPKTVMVLNTGSAPLNITSVAIGTGEPFALSPIPPLTLAPQESHSLVVTFSPTAEGNVTGTLTLTTDDADKPIVTVALAGSGTQENEGGGCSCGATEGGSAGMLALLLLAGLGSRRRRHPHGTYGF